MFVFNDTHASGIAWCAVDTSCAGVSVEGTLGQPSGLARGAWQSDGVTKTQYYTATSLDGYIADEHNSLDWLFEVDRAEGDDHSFTRFLPT